MRCSNLSIFIIRAFSVSSSIVFPPRTTIIIFSQVIVPPADLATLLTSVASVVQNSSSRPHVIYGMPWFSHSHFLEYKLK